jgi:hypothetical protein
LRHGHEGLVRGVCPQGLIVNSPEQVDSKELITSYLAELKRRVEATLERRFIYFFASRTKVRFDVARQPYYELFTGKLVITFLIGAKKRRFRWKTNVLNARTGNPLRPKITASDKFIRIWKSEHSSVLMSVHDFIRDLGIPLGINSRVHYVGITKNPKDRPITRKHRGITDILHNISNEANDFFLFVNILKVVARTCEPDTMLHFFAANAMTDEVPVGPEGAIIEHGLVAYFDSPFQAEEKSKERASLVKNLQSFRDVENIHGVLFDMEAAEPDEYFRYCSDHVPPADRHVFMCSVVGDRLMIKRHSATFDAEAFFFGENYSRPVSGADEVIQPNDSMKTPGVAGVDNNSDKVRK